MDKNYIGFVYIWLNNFNDKKYIGAHIGKIDDGYIGSGKAFSCAIKKYGMENFTREILYYEYESEQNLFQKEFEIINQYNAVLDENFYNMTNISPKQSKFVSGKYVKIVTDETKKKIREIALKRETPNQDTRNKMSKNNHMRGKRWFNNGQDNKAFLVGKEPAGWILGRLKTSQGNSGYRTYNNGIIEKQFPSNAEPTDEWKRGRLPSNIKSGKDNPFYNKKHSDETITKIKNSKKKRKLNEISK